MSGPPADEAPERCLVPACGEPALRHLALGEAREVFSDLPEAGRRRAPLCREHYRQWKKATRERRALARLGR